MTENFTLEERKTAFAYYGSDSDEVCYAASRMEKIGALPYLEKENEGKTDIEVYEGAFMQAAETGTDRIFYLKGIGGLFLASRDSSIAFSKDRSYTEYCFNNFIKNKDKLRWDKPIEQQKKEQEFDRFKNYEYGLELYKNWNASSLEECYAAERLKKMGVIPYQGKKIGSVEEIFASVVQEASKTGKKQAITFCSGVINGMFVVPPLKEGDAVEEMYERYVKNQDRLRWDKPIEQQKAEERAVSNKLLKKQNN